MSQADPKSSYGQEQQKITQTVQNTHPYPQHFEDDTIDLYELWISLWKGKWLIVAVTVVAALGSIVYALQLQPIYKAQALLLPPKAKDIQSMIVFGNKKLIKEDSNSNTIVNLSKLVFAKFKQNLNSRTLHRKFIQENGLMELLAPERTAENRDEDIYKGFAELIKLEEGKNGLTSISIELYDAKIAAQWVNNLIEFIDKETITMVLEDSHNSILNQIRDIEYKISSKREMAKLRREDQIIRYVEAASIAESLGIKRRVDATNIIQNTQMNVDIAAASTPLYYLGLEALSTEITILKERKSDDPFISGLRDLQEELALLRSIKLDRDKINSVYIDQAAYPPKYAIKPNRRMIVSIATVVGLFAGVFLTFFIGFLQNQRKKHLE